MTTRTDIVGVELVNSYKCTGSGEPKGPSHDRTPDRELAFMQIVGENSVELFSTRTPKNATRFSQQCNLFPPPLGPARPPPGLTPICEWTTKLRARTPSRIG